MSLSIFCIKQREKEQRTLRSFIIYSLVGSSLFHLIVGLGIEALWRRKPAIAKEDPIEVIIVDTPKPEEIEKPEEQKTTEEPKQLESKPKPITKTTPELAYAQQPVLANPIKIPFAPPKSSVEPQQKLPQQPTAISKKVEITPLSQPQNEATETIQPQPIETQLETASQKQPKISQPLRRIERRVRDALTRRPNAESTKVQVSEPSSRSPGNVASNQTIARSSTQSNQPLHSSSQESREFRNQINRPSNSSNPIDSNSPQSPERVAANQEPQKPSIIPQSLRRIETRVRNVLTRRPNTESNKIKVSEPSSRNPGNVATNQTIARSSTQSSQPLHSSSQESREFRNQINRSSNSSNPGDSNSEQLSGNPGNVATNQTIARSSTQSSQPLHSSSQESREFRNQINRSSNSSNPGDSNSEQLSGNPGNVATNQTIARSSTQSSQPIQTSSQESREFRNQINRSSNSSNPGDSISPNAPQRVAANQVSPNKPTSRRSEEGGLQCVRNCKPKYPSGLREQGRPVVSLTVGENGQVIDSQLVRSSGNSQLDQAALQGSRRMRFAPPGERTTTRVAISFALEGTDFHREARERQARLERERQERERQTRLERERQERERKERERQAQLEREQQERERQAQQEQERKERERQAQLEREQQERERQAQQEQKRQAQQEQERQAQQEQERQAQQEQERQAQQEQERQAQQEQERQAQQEQERQAQQEQERQAQQERERQAQLEQERQAQQEQERQAQQERERQAQQERERQAQQERERQAQQERGASGSART